MNIIVPTYPPHFLWNKLFLKSFKKHCINYEKSSIQFIVNKNDYSNFIEVIKELLDENIKIKIFEKILINCGQKYIFYPTNDYEKYSFQSIKKMFSVIDSEYEKNLVLDSENIVVKDFKFEELFINEDKIFYCDWITSHVQNNVVNSCNRLLNLNNTKWFFETSFWIYNKQEFIDIIEYIIKNNNIEKQNLVAYLKNFVFFEKNLYDLWKIKIKGQSNDIFNQDDCLTYFKDSPILNELNGKLITTEHMISYISNEEDIEKYIKFVNNRNYNILRVNDLLSVKSLEGIINSTDAKILTVFDNKKEIYDFWSKKIYG